MLLAMMAPVAVGLATLHLAFGQVLAAYPERTCERCDGYVAVVDCAEMGRRYVLELAGQGFDVIVADCLDPADQAAHDAFWAGSWIVDVDAALWGDLPEQPQPAALWRAADWMRMERIR